MIKSYKLGLYEKAMPNSLTLKEKLEVAKKQNYDYVELSVDETPEKMDRIYMSKSQRLDIVKKSFDVGIGFKSMALSGQRKYPLGSKSEDTRKKSLEILEKAIYLASDLSIPIIQLAGYDVYYEESWNDSRKYFIENMIKSSEIAAKEGVILAFETMETEFMDTVEKAMEYVNIIDSAYVGVYPDLGNITNSSKIYGSDVFEDYRKARGHIFSTHFKESLPSIYRELKMGEGHVDFERFSIEAIDLGVRRFVAEMWHVGNDDWEENIRDANVFIRQHLDNAIQLQGTKE